MLLVVGAGFAGLSAALQARRSGVAVMVVAGRERTVDAPECLSPEGLRALHVCGIDARSLDLPSVREHVSRWGESPTSSRVLPLGIPQGLLLGRAQLLRALHARALQAGVTFVDVGELDHVLSATCGLRLKFAKPASEYTLEAGFAIDASGRAAVLARKLGVGRRTFDHLVAYGVRGPVHAMPVGVVHTFTVADGWMYAVSDAPGQAHACFYTNGRFAGRLTAATVMQRLPREIRSLVSDEEAWHACSVSAANASTSLLDVPGGAYWLACGDALQTVDPLSSSGITTALQQGTAAASAAVASLKGDMESMKAYWLESRAMFDRYVRNRNGFYGFSEGTL